MINMQVQKPYRVINVWNNGWTKGFHVLLGNGITASIMLEQGRSLYELAYWQGNGETIIVGRFTRQELEAEVQALELK